MYRAFDINALSLLKYNDIHDTLLSALQYRYLTVRSFGNHKRYPTTRAHLGTSPSPFSTTNIIFLSFPYARVILPWVVAGWKGDCWTATWIGPSDSLEYRVWAHSPNILSNTGPAGYYLGTTITASLHKGILSHHGRALSSVSAAPNQARSTWTW